MVLDATSLESKRPCPLIVALATLTMLRFED